jgi:hypothetical protein
MAWNWPNKKDTPPDPRPKREFPSAFDTGFSLDDADKGSEASAESTKPPSPPAQAIPLDSDPLTDLAEQLNQLGRLVDETRQQVAAQMMQGDVARKLDSLCEKLSRSGDGGSSSINQMLDRIYGKLVVLADSPARPAAEGGGGPPAVSEGALRGAMKPLAEKLEQVDAKLKAVEDLKSGFIGTLTKLRDGITEQHTALGNGIRQVHDTIPQYFNALPQYFTALQQQMATSQQQLAAGVKEVLNILRPPQPEPTAAGPAVSGDWQEAVLGPELASNPALGPSRQQLFRGVLSGEQGACGLAGMLLVFRASPAERMPALLKDIGEAYYRWQPRTTSRPTEMEKTLVAWLQRTCTEAGINNVIELVSPGERFDASRHNASERGVEITQVQGWIVLRDNGKVYTKASVAVK